MNVRPFLLAITAAAVLSVPALAQNSVADTSVVAADTAARANAASPSSMDRPSEAVRRNARAADAPMQQTAGLGRPKAMMFVGAAAIVTGAVIGGDAGNVIMVGGAIVGLYGLWQYLQ